MAWKLWEGTDSFGKLERHLGYYYDAEIRRAGLAKIERVLEIGFGNGSFLTYAKSRGWQVVGTEANETLVARAASSGFDARAPADLEVMQDCQFDLIVAFDVFEHLTLEEMIKILNRLKELLRDDGALLLRFPNGDSPLGLALQAGDPTHITAIGTGAIKWLANTAGLRLLFCGGQARTFVQHSLALTVHNLVITPIRKLIELCARMIFYPDLGATFFEKNLMVCLKKIG